MALHPMSLEEGAPLRKAPKWGELHIDPQQREAPADRQDEDANEEQLPSKDARDLPVDAGERENVLPEGGRNGCPAEDREERRARIGTERSRLENARLDRRETAKMSVYRRRWERDQKRAQVREDAEQRHQSRKSTQASASTNWSRGCVIS